MKFLSDEQIHNLLPAETSSFPSPVPTQIVSSEEYLPVPQDRAQREVGRGSRRMSDDLASKQGLSRRPLLPDRRRHGRLVCRDEPGVRTLVSTPAPPRRQRPNWPNQLAQAKSGQMVIDGHTHFPARRHQAVQLRQGREAVGNSAWKQALAKRNRLSTVKYGFR